MMQVIKRWRIILYFDLPEKSITFIIYDNFYSGMLRKLQEINFDLEPSRIEISEIKITETQSGIFTVGSEF